MKPAVLFIANNNIGENAVSGGDTIFIAFMKYWADKADISIAGSQEALTIAHNEGVKGINEITISTKRPDIPLDSTFSIWNFLKHILVRTKNGVLYVFAHKKELNEYKYVYSLSDFYPDFIPALVLKLLNKEIKWIAGYYLVTVPIWHKNSPYRKSGRLKGFFYWLMQKPSLFLVKAFADYVFVTSLPDKPLFVTKNRSEKNVIVVQGGVDTSEAEKYLASQDTISLENKYYDACYIGRFHIQKGVLELVEIWKKLVETDPSKKLVMIGDGELFDKVSGLVKTYRLENNIFLVGYKLNADKYNIFKNSKIVLHPATFDSGGMAAAEAMAWGLPGVSFDLPALQTYYPKGMVKVPCFDNELFAKAIQHLLTDREFYYKIRSEALELIRTTWVWEARANAIFESVFNDRK